MTSEQTVTFTVNGRTTRVIVEPRRNLADTLREVCGLTGTHVGCEHGVCGACTVLVDGRPIRACLVFAVQLEGATIETVESLAAPDGTLHPLQQAFWEHHGLQCGFCTPGFLMLALGALREKPDLNDEEIREIVASNLCRCTGYQNILTAVKAAAAAMRGSAS
jgi:carbon-monoxide dehydrogenase small subunit